MRSVLGRTKILIVPSQVEEGGPRVITEAQLNGLPVVASNIGGIPEVLGNGGVLLDPSDTVAWVTAIKEVWANPDVFQSLSQMAKCRANTDLSSHERVADEYEAFLRSCIARQVGGRELHLGSGFDRTAA
jgi:glycosyltransferase involved in cell wall biosynthesis